jgi:hypothetical protein
MPSGTSQASRIVKCLRLAEKEHIRNSRKCVQIHESVNRQLMNSSEALDDAATATMASDGVAFVDRSELLLECKNNSSRFSYA